MNTKYNTILMNHIYIYIYIYIYNTCKPANLMDVKHLVLQHNSTTGLITTVGLILSTL